MALIKILREKKNGLEMKEQGLLIVAGDRFRLGSISRCRQSERKCQRHLEEDSRTKSQQ